MAAKAWIWCKKVGFDKWNTNLADLGLELIPSGKEHLS